MESVKPMVRYIIDNGVPTDAVKIYNGRRNKVFAVASPAGTGFEQLNIKAYRVPPWINRLIYGRLRRGKARRAFDNARRLVEMGIRTAAPIAFIEERGLLYGRSYFISEQLGTEWKELRGAHEWPDFEPVARALAAYLAGLHRLQVWMKDFSPGNVLMRRKDDRNIEFALIDINRMEFDVTDRDKLMTNFQAIFDTVEATEMFARYYAEVIGVKAGSDEGKSIVAVARKAFEDKHAQIARKRKLKQLFK